MAIDGAELNAGSGGVVVATDRVGGFDYQIVKIGVGADDAAPTSVSSANPLPADIKSSVPSSNVTTSGTLTASGQAVSLSVGGLSSVGVEISGLAPFPGGDEVLLEGTIDDSTWFEIGRYDIDTGIYIAGGGGGNQITVDERFVVVPSGMSQVRIRATAVTSVTVAMVGSVSQAGIHALVGRNASNNLGQASDSIKAYLASNALMDGLNLDAPVFTLIDTASSGDTELRAGTSSRVWRVHSFVLNASGDVDVEFQSGGTTTNLSGTLEMGTSSGKIKSIVVPFSPVGHFESASGKALDINLSAAVQVSGHIVTTNPTG